MALKPPLFIPRKEQSPVKQPDYSIDMRAIEMWAQGVSGGGTAGAVSFSCLVDTGGGVVVPFGGMANTSIGLGSVTALMPLFAGDTGYPPGSFFSGTVITVVIGGGGWYSIPTAAAGYHVFESVQVFAPNFTGPTSTIGIIVYLRVAQVAVAAGAVNAFKTVSSQINIASGGHHVFASGDFPTNTLVGTDLTFAAGATLNSAGGLPYIGGWAVSVVWDTANTLTQA